MSQPAAVPRLLAIVLLASLVRAGDFTEPEPVPGTFILTALTAQAAAPADSSAFARMDIADDGTQSLVVRVLGLPTGDYDVWRDTFAPGFVLEGTIAIGADGTGLLSVTPPSSPFDNFFKWFEFAVDLEIRQGATVLFDGTLDPPGGGVLLDDDVHCSNGARLIAVGDDLDARGQLVFRSVFGHESLDVQLDGLTPGPYVVQVGGVPQLLMDANAKGRARLRQCTPVKPGFGENPVDTVGKEIRVLDASGALVLSARMPWDPDQIWSRPPSRQKFRDVGDGAADGLRVDFVKHGYNGYGGLDRGWIAWQRDEAGAASLTVRIIGQDFTPAQPYGVWVAGALVGTVGESEQWHDFNITNTFAVAPDVDLRAQRVELRDGAEIGLSLTFPQSVPAGVRSYHVELRKPNRMRLDLLNPGTDLDATGLLDWRMHAGSQRLRLVVRDLPAGVYDLALDGSLVAPAAIVVAENGGPTEALFTSEGSEGSLLLDFDVTGTLQIRASGTTTEYLRQSLEH
jgi:hypothetical protein